MKLYKQINIDKLPNLFSPKTELTYYKEAIKYQVYQVPSAICEANAKISIRLKVPSTTMSPAS